MSTPEPEYQWLEDALIILAQAGCALFGAILTVCVELTAAVFRVLMPED